MLNKINNKKCNHMRGKKVKQPQQKIKNPKKKVMSNS